MQRMLAKVVLFNIPFLEQGKGHFYILKVFECDRQVEVFDIKTHVSGKGSADDTVPIEFGCIQIGCAQRCA